MSGGSPDVSRITPPAEPPPDKPDPQTSAESEEYKKKKAPSAVEREADAHRAHLATKSEQIAYHVGEKEQLKQELRQAQNDFTHERNRSEDLAIRNAQLEIMVRSVGCMTALGTFMTVTGSILLGIGGAAPDLSGVQKAGFTWSGTAAAVCGGILVLAAFIAGLLSKPSKPSLPRADPH